MSAGLVRSWTVEPGGAPRPAEPLADPATVPGGTVLVELRVPSGGAHDLGRYGALAAEERELVAGAVDKRRAEFGDARWCAHRALEETGIPDPWSPVLRGERGMPLLPAGACGALTHTAGYRAALVGRSTRWRSLGLDAEVARPLPEGVLEMVSTPGERRALGRVPGLPPELAGTVLFSAKESVYKAWFPVAGTFLDFGGASMELLPDGRWTARILDPGPLGEVSGRWALRGGVAVTIAAVPA